MAKQKLKPIKNPTHEKRKTIQPNDFSLTRSNRYSKLLYSPFYSLIMNTNDCGRFDAQPPYGPVSGDIKWTPLSSFPSISRRDFFVAMAIQSEVGSMYINPTYQCLEISDMESRVKACIQLADEIIKQLES